jgi:hypothetical protein
LVFIAKQEQKVVMHVSFSIPARPIMLVNQQNGICGNLVLASTLTVQYSHTLQNQVPSGQLGVGNEYDH